MPGTQDRSPHSRTTSAPRLRRDRHAEPVPTVAIVVGVLTTRADRKRDDAKRQQDREWDSGRRKEDRDRDDQLRPSNVTTATGTAAGI